MTAQRVTSIASGAQPVCEFVVVTPAEARAYLGHNDSNRNVRPTLVRQYADDMRDGNWNSHNGETIKITKTGVLVDGQHRLHAVVLANVAVGFWVMRSVTEHAQETIDAGAKRSFADVLKLRGEDHPGRLATSVRAIAIYEARGRAYNKGATGHATLSNARLLACLDRYPWVRDGLGTLTKAAEVTGVGYPVSAVLYWLFWQIDGEDCLHFFERLTSDEHHEHGDPISELRRAYLAIGTRVSRKRPGDNAYLVAIGIKAWNKYRNGERVTQLGFRPGGAKPEPWPEAR